MADPYRRNTLELTLEGVTGDGPWGRSRGGSERLVTASLIWPRPLVAQRVSAHPLRFGQEGLEMAGRDWSEKVLFKEAVEGPFGLVVQISQTMTAQQLTRLAAALGDIALRAVGSEAGRLVDGSGLTSLARFPFTYLASQLSGVGKTPQVVAAGRMTLLPGERGAIDLPLVVPEDVVRVRRVRQAGRVQSRREVLHTSGDFAGVVHLRAVYYRD